MVKRAQGSVASLGLLGRFGDSYIVEGDEVYVASEKTWYYYSLTAEGADAIKAQYIPGYWCRKEDDSGAFNTQLVWYVNSVTGSDNNDGLTSGTAIKTFAQLRERVGTPWYLPAAQVDIYVSGVFPLPDTLELDIEQQETTSVVFHGAESVVAHVPTGFTAKTDMARGTNTRPDVTEASVNWTTYEGLLIKDTATSPAKYAWISADLGAGQARTSAWLAFDPVSTTINPAAATVAVSDPFSIVIGPRIYYTSIKVRPINRMASACVIFDNIDLYWEFEAYAPGGVILLSNCRLPLGATYGPGLTVMQNCEQDAGTHVVLGELKMLAGRQYGSNSSFALAGGQMMLDYDPMFEADAGSGVEFAEGVLSSLIVDCAAFFKTGGNGLRVGPGGLVRCTGVMSNARTLWGEQVGGASVGMPIQSNGRVIYDSGFDFTMLNGLGGPGVADFTIAGQATAFAFDNAAAAYHAVAHACTWALLATNIAGGGFDYNIIDPLSGAQISKYA